MRQPDNECHLNHILSDLCGWDCGWKNMTVMSCLHMRTCVHVQRGYLSQLLLINTAACWLLSKPKLFQCHHKYTWQLFLLFCFIYFFFPWPEDIASYSEVVNIDTALIWRGSNITCSPSYRSICVCVCVWERRDRERDRLLFLGTCEFCRLWQHVQSCLFVIVE